MSQRLYTTRLTTLIAAGPSLQLKLLDTAMCRTPSTKHVKDIERTVQSSNESGLEPESFGTLKSR